MTDPNQDYRRWLLELGARRPFGPRDRIGTANHIDDAARGRAAAAARTGRQVGLARPLVPQPSPRQDDKPGFSVEVFYTDGPIGMGSDHVEYDCHGITNTHIDAINHIALERTWYCGWDVDDPDGPSVAHLAEHGLFTRGVLIDVPGLRGTPWADPEQPVGAPDFDAALAAGGVTFEPGDALLVYMGRDRFEAAGNVYRGSHGGGLSPGIGRDGAQWIVDHDVSLVCWDFLDSNHSSQPAAPVHLLIWAIGLILVDNCDLAPAAALARATGSITGALTVAPLAVPGGTGCLVRPQWVQ
jgi:kynurenine formamidase